MITKILERFIFIILTHLFSILSRCCLPRSRRLHTTSERLGAAAAYTTVYAGYKRSFSHCLFRGVSAAVAPNRQLAAGIF